MGAILRALAIAMQASLGWVASDIYNEYNRSSQVTGEQPSIKGAIVGSGKKNWVGWVIGFGVMALLVWVFFLIRKLISQAK